MAEIVKRTRHDGYFNSVKRTKHDSLKLTVGSYLARRHYSENEVLKKAVTCEEMIVSHLIDKEVARPNSILFSNPTYRNAFNNDPDPILVESYFYNFISWINGLPNEDIKNDLSELVCPLFCHLYLDLLNTNSQQSANIYKFYQEQKNIKENDICSLVVKELTMPDVKTRPIINSFRSSKYHITLSLEATNLVKSYLAKHGHILILQLEDIYRTGAGNPCFAATAAHPTLSRASAKYHVQNGCGCPKARIACDCTDSCTNGTPVKNSFDDDENLDFDEI